MPGYAANLVGSGARKLTTRGRTYAAATITLLRASRGKQTSPETSVANAVPPADISASISQDQHSPTTPVAAPQTRESNGAVFQVKAEMPIEFTPGQIVRTPERDPVASASPAQLRPASEASTQASPRPLVPVKPDSARNEAETATLPQETIDPLRVAAATSRHSTASTRDENIGHKKQTDSQAATAASPSEKPDIISRAQETMAPNAASHGAYHGRRIRVEHSNPVTNPAVALMQQRPAAAYSSDATPTTNAKELIPRSTRPAEQATGFLASRSIPRISTPAQGDAPAIATTGKIAEVVDRPSLSSPRPAAGSPTSAQESSFATAAARRHASREDRQPEGPRLNIGLLEVQIIQEVSEAPPTRTQPRGLANEQDVLERSYIRQIG